MSISRIVGSLLLGAAAFFFVLLPCALTGCTQKPKDKAVTQAAKATDAKKEKAAKESEEAEIKASLAKLSPEDRKLAEAQKYCVVQTDELLGSSMGVPVKLMIKGTPVFVCCKSCKKDAEANPDKTLKTLAELKSKNQAAAPTKQ